VIALHVSVSEVEKQQAARVLDEAACALAATGFVSLDTQRDWSAGRRDVAEVHFVHDPLTADDGPRLATRLAEIIDGAQSSVVIESPYLVPTPGLLELLRKKLREGVRVQILTNSFRSGDGILPYVGYVKYRRRLIHAGIDLREYKGPNMLHAKSMVIDGRTVLIGSYNVDPRSQNLNAEAMCIAEDEEAARELTASIDEHVQNAWIVGAGRKARMPRVTRLRAWALRLLLPLFERQL
jgi:putative cardiolipin synthase